MLDDMLKKVLPIPRTNYEFKPSTNPVFPNKNLIKDKVRTDWSKEMDG